MAIKQRAICILPLICVCLFVSGCWMPNGADAPAQMAEVVFVNDSSRLSVVKAKLCEAEYNVPLEPGEVSAPILVKAGWSSMLVAVEGKPLPPGDINVDEAVSVQTRGYYWEPYLHYRISVKVEHQLGKGPIPRIFDYESDIKVTKDL